ncbi:asparagine synthase-related protein [Seleniivibrio woodruffii]|uniref:asparagine synthase-related protein n=1 Tax=Seleniivibrio woodruffii TaxID=1078050 RepID=UPI0026EBC98B|nr:asparagine synthase-related protein [Seleniivibrio woodruffii]
MEAYFKRFKTAYVALSGGADSAAVLMLAAEYMGTENVKAFTCTGGHVFGYEIEKAAEISAKVGVVHITAPADMPAVFFENTPDRCYHCKRAVLSKIAEYAGTEVIFDGTNTDDDPASRPGFRALAETGVVSPLRDLGLGKSFTLEKVKSLEIDFHDESCKATRLTLPIDSERMDRVERAENLLRDRYRGIRYKIDENRIEFKKTLTLSADDFGNIVNTVRLTR